MQAYKVALDEYGVDENDPLTGDDVHEECALIAYMEVSFGNIGNFAWDDSWKTVIACLTLWHFYAIMLIFRFLSCLFCFSFTLQEHVHQLSEDDIFLLLDYFGQLKDDGMDDSILDTDGSGK